MNPEKLFFTIQHYCNPLHIYCRLVDRSISKKTSKWICRCYEILIYWAINLISIAGIFICRILRHLSSAFCRPAKVFLTIFSIFLMVILLITAAHAGSNIMFAWDANTEADLAGYRLYQSTTSGQYEYGPDHCLATIPAGTETVTLGSIADGTWYWVLTAFDKTGNESGPSNEVTATVDTVAPAQPKTLRTLYRMLLLPMAGIAVCGRLIV